MFWLPETSHAPYQSVHHIINLSKSLHGEIVQMWPTLIAKAKEDVIQTYVFWNVHEPVQGQVDVLTINQVRYQYLSKPIQNIQWKMSGSN